MRRISAAVLGVAATFLLTVAAQAQPKSQRVNVPFKFNLADKAFPASTYLFKHEAASNQVEVLDQQMSTVGRLAVITRLPQRAGMSDGRRVRLVFDEEGGERYLSEVWFPSAGGLLVRATSTQHTHAEVDSADRAADKTQR
jgi:hypothetical protein